MTKEKQAAIDMLAQLRQVTHAEAFTAITILTVALARSAGVLNHAQRAVFMEQMVLALNLQFTLAEEIAEMTSTSDLAEAMLDAKSHVLQ